MNEENPFFNNNNNNNDDDDDDDNSNNRMNDEVTTDSLTYNEDDWLQQQQEHKLFTIHQKMKYMVQPTHCECYYVDVKSNADKMMGINHSLLPSFLLLPCICTYSTVLYEETYCKVKAKSVTDGMCYGTNMKQMSCGCVETYSNHIFGGYCIICNTIRLNTIYLLSCRWLSYMLFQHHFGAYSISGMGYSFKRNEFIKYTDDILELGPTRITMDLV